MRLFPKVKDVHSKGKGLRRPSPFLYIKTQAKGGPRLCCIRTICFAKRKEVKDKLQEAAAREVGVHKSKVEIHGAKAKILGSDIQEINISELFKNTSPYEQGCWGLMKFSPVVGHGIFSPAPIRK